MKKQKNSVRASALQITLAVAAVSISAILLASTRNAASAISPSDENAALSPNLTRNSQPSVVCGRIDTADSLAVEQHIFSNPPLTGCSLIAADVSGDGSINQIDFITIMRFYLGFTSALGRTGTDAGCGLCYGDVVSGISSPFPGVTISLPTANLDTSVDITTVIVLPVVTTNIDASSGFIGFQGDFTFDERVVTFTSVPTLRNGLISPSHWTLNGNILPGTGPFRTLRVSGFAEDFAPLSGSGTLFSLRMLRVSSTPGDMSNLVPVASQENFEFIDTTRNYFVPAETAGLITITTQTPTPTPAPINLSGTISYCSNPSPGPVPDVTLSLTGSTSGSTVSDGSGNYSFSSLVAGGSYTVIPTKAALTPTAPGITTVDAAAVELHFLDITPIPPGCRLIAADVNGDSLVNTLDAIAIQRFYLGMTTGTSNVGTYQFNPASRTYLNLGSDQTNQNYDALVLGDVAGPFADRPSDPSEDSANADEAPPTVATVALPDVALDSSKSNFTTAVMTSAIDPKNKLVGFQGDFIFDERAVTFQSEPVQNAGLTSRNWNVSGNVLDGKGPIRTLRISAYSNDFTPLSGEGTLFELKTLSVSKAQGTQLFWAAPPNDFIFIDADLKTRKPGNAEHRSVTEATCL